MKFAALAASTILLASVFGSLALAQGGAADRDKRCLSAEDWTSLVSEKSSGVAIAVLADIDGMEAKQVVDRINAEPPQTHMAADHVIVLGAKSVETDQPAPYVLVAFFDHGCLVASGRADPEGVADVLQGEST